MGRPFLQRYSEPRSDDEAGDGEPGHVASETPTNSSKEAIEEINRMSSGQDGPVKYQHIYVPRSAVDGRSLYVYVLDEIYDCGTRDLG